VTTGRCRPCKLRLCCDWEVRVFVLWRHSPKNKTAVSISFPRPSSIPFSFSHVSSQLLPRSDPQSLAKGPLSGPILACMGQKPQPTNFGDFSNVQKERLFVIPSPTETGPIPSPPTNCPWRIACTRIAKHRQWPLSNPKLVTGDYCWRLIVVYCCRFVLQSTQSVTIFRRFAGH